MASIQVRAPVVALHLGSIAGSAERSPADILHPNSFRKWQSPISESSISLLPCLSILICVSQNKQIDVALNSAIASKALSSPSAKLSEEGRHLVSDLRNVIEQAKILLLTKNEGNLLQDFIYQTGQVSGGEAKLPGAPLDKATAQQHGNQALEGLRTLGTLILSNGQFRKLC